MANSSQGISVSWGGNTLGELVSVSLDGVSADTIEITSRTDAGRFKQFRAADIDAGSLSITLRSFDYLFVSTVGSTATLQVQSGDPPAIYFDLGIATCQSLAWSATVGELQEYRVVFKLSSASD